MYARKSQDAQKDPVVGGKPISEDLAVELRQIVFGSSVTPPRGEWLRMGFAFRDPDQEFSYGLKGPRNSTRGLLSVVQAYIIKYFLFDKKKMEVVAPELLLKPNKRQQTEALWSALSTIIWMVGEKKNCCVCLPRDSSSPQNTSAYFADGVTEFFLQEPGPGALLLLYSAILTRGVVKIKADLENDKTYLVACEEEGSGCIITLLLTGRATPYLHNGVIYVGDEDHYALPQWGIMARSEIGFLIYNDSIDCKNLEESKQPGSRLKTPSFPVWVINCSGHHGVLFNTNSELLRNYLAERRFDLHYFSVGGNHLFMSIDTRYQDKQNDNRDNGKSDENTLIASSSIEKLIHTKWQDARINFNDMIPPL
ncbi:hypothetical protein RUM43_000799 [Polyplax serrata]|uniref:Ubiquitin carboxyl-terminal hydrolase MINDY n=1 Tax=Polyplax serrata TaxID=468196 RepID=A0AAN8XSU5_POLSC